MVSLNNLQALESAIEARRVSLGKTLEDMSLKVKTGRSPESELLKIQRTLNDLDQQRNELDVIRLDTLREIHSLTGIELTAAADMTLMHRPGGASYLPVIAVQYNTDAEKEVDRRRAARWPTLSVTGLVSGNDGEAYNTDSHIYRSYNQIALVLKFPLFDPGRLFALRSDVLTAQSHFTRRANKWWQVLSQQAALYGADLRGMVQ